MTISGGDLPYAFEWDNGAISQDIDALTADDYCVTITDGNGCKIERCATVGTGTAIFDLLKISELTLYPNPASDVATLDIRLTEAVEIRIHLLDDTGRMLESHQPSINDEVEVRFDVQQLSAGPYLISIEVGDHFMSLPLIIQH